MATITITTDQLKSALPAAFAPILDAALPVFASWGKDQLSAWIALAQSDADTALAQLLAAMPEDALTAQTEADGARLDADTANNAAEVAKWQSLAKSAFSALLVLAQGLIAVGL